MDKFRTSPAVVALIVGVIAVLTLFTYNQISDLQKDVNAADARSGTFEKNYEELSNRLSQICVNEALQDSDQCLVDVTPVPEEAVTGAQGAAGSDGAAGANGIDGVNGRDGSDGAQGPRGFIGPIGPNGLPGANGQDGSNGSAGSNGVNGTDGQSITGARGEKGDKGEKGEPGTDGQNGTNGVDGQDGQSFTCPDGSAPQTTTITSYPNGPLGQPQNYNALTC